MAFLALETAEVGDSGRMLIAAMKTYIGGQVVNEILHCWRIYAIVDDPCEIGGEKGRCLHGERWRRKSTDDSETI